jgi:hypothetical protein
MISSLLSLVVKGRFLMVLKVLGMSFLLVLSTIALNIGIRILHLMPHEMVLDSLRGKIWGYRQLERLGEKIADIRWNRNELLYGNGFHPKVSGTKHGSLKLRKSRR